MGNLISELVPSGNDVDDNSIHRALEAAVMAFISTTIGTDHILNMFLSLRSREPWH